MLSFDNVISSSDPGLIVLIVAGAIVGILVLIGVYLLLDKYFFAKAKCKRLLKQIDARYEHLHTLLTAQDFQYIQRLEVISRTNLLYVEVYANYFKRYKEIKDINEENVNAIIEKLTVLLNKSNINGFKKFYKQSNYQIRTYEELVTKLDNDLCTEIKPEEDARNNSLQLKDKFKEIKSKYNLKEEELAYVSESFSRIFNKINERFVKFEGLIDNAEYNEGTAILPEINQVLDVLDDLIVKCPELINRANVIIPQEISDLKEHYASMIERKFPLGHVYFDKSVANMNSNLSEIQDKIRELNTSNASSKLDDIEVMIRNIEKVLDSEEAAQKEFSENCNRVDDSFNSLEKEYIKVRSNLDKYSKYYVVDDEHLRELSSIQKELEDVSKDKNRLDIYRHSIEMSPYSVLVIKMRELDNGTKELYERFNAFKEYLASLKSDTEEAFSYISRLYFQLKEYERTLREVFNEDYSNKFNSDFDKCYKLIDDIHVTLKRVPINVNLIDSYKTELEDKSSIMLGRIDQDVKFRDLCNEEMMFLNRARVKFSEVNGQLIQAEGFYFNGNFGQAYDIITGIEDRLNQKDEVK